MQTTFPNVTLVLDAPVQMQRELANMRQASGQLATADLEAMLSAIAKASAETPVALRSIQYQRQANGSDGQFSGDASAASAWPELQAALRRAGWATSVQDNSITLRPAQP